MIQLFWKNQSRQKVTLCCMEGMYFSEVDQVNHTRKIFLLLKWGRCQYRIPKATVQRRLQENNRNSGALWTFKQQLVYKVRVCYVKVTIANFGIRTLEYFHSFHQVVVDEEQQKNFITCFKVTQFLIMQIINFQFHTVGTSMISD